MTALAILADLGSVQIYRRAPEPTQADLDRAEQSSRETTAFERARWRHEKQFAWREDHWPEGCGVLETVSQDTIHLTAFASSAAHLEMVTAAYLAAYPNSDGEERYHTRFCTPEEKFTDCISRGDRTRENNWY